MVSLVWHFPGFYHFYLILLHHPLWTFHIRKYKLFAASSQMPAKAPPLCHCSQVSPSGLSFALAQSVNTSSVQYGSSQMHSTTTSFSSHWWIILNSLCCSWNQSVWPTHFLLHWKASSGLPMTEALSNKRRRKGRITVCFPMVLMISNCHCSNSIRTPPCLLDCSHNIFFVFIPIGFGKPENISGTYKLPVTCSVAVTSICNLFYLKHSSHSKKKKKI